MHGDATQSPTYKLDLADVNAGSNAQALAAANGGWATRLLET